MYTIVKRFGVVTNVFIIIDNNYNTRSSEIIWICWLGAQETFIIIIIINDENNSAT